MVETKMLRAVSIFVTMPASIQRVSNLPLGNVPVAMPLASINLDESLGQIQICLKPELFLPVKESGNIYSLVAGRKIWGKT